MYSWNIITTGDGSHSIGVPGLNETYHSIHGAVTESRHVYIKNGLRYLLTWRNADSIRILEIGLGTGLNVILSVLENRKFNRAISYTAVEPFPLPESILNQLNYPGMLGGESVATIFNKIHSCPWNEFFKIDQQFSLMKRKSRYEDIHPGSRCFDLIYYDAFSAGRQPELWELSLLRKTAESLDEHGILVTYAAKGQLKRDLKSLGLEVEPVPGPPGKKEMTRAIKPGPIQ